MHETQQKLPTGYSYYVSTQISDEQIGVMYHPRFVDSNSISYLAEGYRSHDSYAEDLGISALYIGVISTQGETVGTGCLRYNHEAGELSCLAVLPNHQNQGIGSWLIAERLRRAHTRQIPQLFVERLSPTNTIGGKYFDLGFTLCNSHERTSVFAYKPVKRRVPYLVIRFTEG